MEVPRPAGSLQAPSLHYWLRQERRRTRRLINALRDEPADRAALVADLPALPLARPRSRGFNTVAQEFAPDSLRPYRDEPVAHPSIEFAAALLASLEIAEAAAATPVLSQQDAAACLQADERPPASTPWSSEEDAAARIQKAWRRCGARGAVGTVVQAEPGPAAPDAAVGGEVAAGRSRRRSERRVRKAMATQIQAAWREHARRRRGVMASRIQAAWARRSHFVSLREAGRRGANTNAARIQAAWKGYLYRHEYAIYNRFAAQDSLAEPPRTASTMAAELRREHPGLAEGAYAELVRMDVQSELRQRRTDLAMAAHRCYKDGCAKYCRAQKLRERLHGPAAGVSYGAAGYPGVPY